MPLLPASLPPKTPVPPRDGSNPAVPPFFNPSFRERIGVLSWRCNGRTGRHYFRLHAVSSGASWGWLPAGPLTCGLLSEGCLSLLLPFHASYKLALEAFRTADGIQGIYLPCGRWAVVGNLRAIEEDTGACAVSSIQSMAWWGLKTLGIREKITGYGKLLETLG